MTALGSWLTIPLLYIVNSGGSGKEWVPVNIDDGHLDYYFFLLAALMLVNQVLNCIRKFFTSSLLCMLLGVVLLCVYRLRV